jgi:coenzyme F420-reducing hydrogenase delta subunit/ferredoxin
MTSPETDVKGEGWQPRIVAFVCRWCTYAGADLAGTSRLKYPPHIRIVKLPCSGRIDPLFLIRVFHMGADGVLVSGCHPGDCHYTSGNYVARRRWILLRELLDFVGLDLARVHFSWVSAAEGAKFVEVVKRVTEAVRSVGPFPGFDPPGDRRPERTAVLAAVPAGEQARPPVQIDQLRIDLEQGTVRAILGYRTGRRAGSLRPAWAMDAADLSRLCFSPGAQPSLVSYLVRRLREEPEGTYGIVAAAKEIEAIEALKAEQQINPTRVRVYPQDGELPASPQIEPWDRFGVPGPDRPPRERWEFWTAQFARCLRCYACREACPLCACIRCVVDKTRPRWIDASPTPAGNWAWNVTRAFHQAGRCIDCGGCTAACPAGIPLGALNLYMARAAECAFGPRRGGEDQRRSPLLSHRVEDQAPFIM